MAASVVSVTVAFSFSFLYDKIIASLPASIVTSFVLTIIITYITKPTDTEVLVKFYARIRPIGFWKPIRLEAERRALVPVDDRMRHIDLLNGFLASFFQLTLGIIPFHLFLRNWTQALLWSGICLVMIVVLYFTWHKNLPSPDEA
jgi:hypothetical protein